MTKHTAGPWKAVQNSAGAWEIHPTGEFNYHSIAGAHFNEYVSKDESENEANARLIAAAPELLEALGDIRAALIMGNNPNDKGLIEMADEAIAKAEGGTE